MGKGPQWCREAGVLRENGLNSYWDNLQSELLWTEQGREEERGGRRKANSNDPIHQAPTPSPAGATPPQASSRATVFHQRAPEPLGAGGPGWSLHGQSEPTVAPLVTKLHSVSEREDCRAQEQTHRCGPERKGGLRTEGF